MTTTVAIALGGNLGHVAETFDRALAAIDASSDLSVRDRSRNYLTRAIGSQAGNNYLNAVALLDVCCSPFELLHRLQQIETDLGRMRTIRWGPRPLDLDILSYGDDVFNHPPQLIVPHPACWYRRFVLDPWHEVMPDWIHPEFNETVNDLRQRLLVRPLPIVIRGSDSEVTALAAAIATDFPAAEVMVEESNRATVAFHIQEDAQERKEMPAGNPRTILMTPERAEETARFVLLAMLDVPQPQS